MSFPLSRPATADVCHYVAGGRESGGGIGRLVGYIIDAQPPGHRHRVCDTRGPCFRPARSAFRLAAAMAAMLAARVVAPQRVHHLHIAGRGSTARKLILAGLARLIGCHHVLHLHDYDYAADLARRPAWQKAAIGRMFRAADAVIVLGLRDKITATAQLGVSADRVHILRNCVPDPGPRPARLATDPTLIVFLGRLGPRKGVPELLAALAAPEMMASDRPTFKWHAVLAGDGPVEAFCAEAKRLGLSDRVDLPGWLNAEAAHHLCRDADILALPSHAEGMAMAVLEGLAHGMAVVTTRVGAHDEVLEDGVTCSFVPVGDAPALAACLSRLVADPEERTRLGRAARALFLREFGIVNYTKRLDRLYAALDIVTNVELDPA